MIEKQIYEFLSGLRKHLAENPKYSNYSIKISAVDQNNKNQTEKNNKIPNSLIEDIIDYSLFSDNWTCTDINSPSIILDNKEYEICPEINEKEITVYLKNPIIIDDDKVRFK